MSTESDAEKQQPGIPIPWEQDSENPQNWNTWRKALNLGIVSILGFITPLESSVIVPGVPLLKQDFHETRPPVTSLIVSIFVLGFAFGPVLLSPLSELHGRRLMLNICNVVTLGFSIGSALAPNIATFIVFRFIAGSFGAGPMNIGGGSIADQVELLKRGFVMSIFFTGYFLGPVIGPIIGGFVAKDLGWRWVFWIMAIFKGVLTIVTFFFLTESHHPTIQRKRVKDTDMIPNKEAPKVSQVLLRALTRPMRMLIRSPIVTGLSLYLALIYGYLYLLFTTFSTVFTEQYGFGIDILGLAFLGVGIGCIVALVVLSWLSDWLQDRLTNRYGASKPEYRLLPIILGIPLLPIGLFVYGWTAEYEVHWIVPIIFTGFSGAGLIFSFLPTQIYMIDAFTAYAASALAATSVIRSIGNSLLGFIAILVSIAPLLFWRYGEKLRKKYDVQFD
ncbi:major facilitator family transporter [Fusarium denticulatum]|uniref:Major facilitator family transporter n=1 Tax=Fusarium denticulatum TaxID=48507 RepID=A0A8H5X0R3_9HYPO|nr:major facilitator family transporter [Fusarium denticulatum]